MRHSISHSWASPGLAVQGEAVDIGGGEVVGGQDLPAHDGVPEGARISEEIDPAKENQQDPDGQEDHAFGPEEFFHGVIHELTASSCTNTKDYIRHIITPL